MKFMVKSGRFHWNKRNGWRSARRQASRMSLGEAQDVAARMRGVIVLAPTIEERQAIRGFVRASQTGVPFTRRGDLHHGTLMGLALVGLAKYTRSGGKWFWSLRDVARNAA